MSKQKFVSKSLNLKTPWSSATLPSGFHPVSTIVLLVVGFILLSLVGLAILIGAIVVLVLNIIDITHVGPNFWNVLWIILSSLVLLGGLRQTVNR